MILLNLFENFSPIKDDIKDILTYLTDDLETYKDIVTHKIIKDDLYTKDKVRYLKILMDSIYHENEQIIKIY